MSTDHGDDGGGNAPAPWWLNPLADIAVIIAIIIAAFIVIGLVFILMDPISIWWRGRRAKPRESSDDNCELVDRQESIKENTELEV